MFEQTFKNIDDVLWKEAGCATELDYTEQTSWILFLRYLDDLERANEQRAELQGKKYQYIIDAKLFPYLKGFRTRAEGEHDRIQDWRNLQRNRKQIPKWLFTARRAGIDG